MLESIQIFGKTIPMYGIMTILGFVMGILYATIRCKILKLPFTDCLYILTFSGLGAALGAKILYILTVLPQFLKDIPMVFTNPSHFIALYISGGMVFYGGLIGAVLTAYWYTHYMSMDFNSYLPVLVPTFALIHGFGRIGCFFAGCCYGIPVEKPWGICFYHTHVAPIGIPLLPVQLIEAGYEFLLVIILTLTAKKLKKNLYILPMYVLLYAPERFVLEFFRGDAIRGSLGLFSTSQWISIILITVCILYFIYDKFYLKQSKKSSA